MYLSLKFNKLLCHHNFSTEMVDEFTSESFTSMLHKLYINYMYAKQISKKYTKNAHDST